MNETPKVARVEVTKTQEPQTISAQEEKVLRMRYGLTAPLHQPLEKVGQNNVQVQAYVEQLEQRLLAAAGHRDNTTKQRIIDVLNRKQRRSRAASTQAEMG